MSYHLDVSQAQTPGTLNAFKNLIQSIGQRGIYEAKEVVRVIHTEHNIIISEYQRKGSDRAFWYTPVEFPSEKDYLLFLLRWS